MYYIYQIREYKNIRRFEYSYQIFPQTLIKVPLICLFIGIRNYDLGYNCTFKNHTISILGKLEVIDPSIFFISDTKISFSYSLPNFLGLKYHFRYFNCSPQRKCRITLFVYNAGRHLKLVG